MIGALGDLTTGEGLFNPGEIRLAADVGVVVDVFDVVVVVAKKNCLRIYIYREKKADLHTCQTSGIFEI